MSAGDSVTVGLCARTPKFLPHFLFYEDIGVNYATGGDPDAVSLATLIEKEEGIEVLGKSYGTKRFKACPGTPLEGKCSSDSLYNYFYYI